MAVQSAVTIGSGVQLLGADETDRVITAVHTTRGAGKNARSLGVPERASKSADSAASADYVKFQVMIKSAASAVSLWRLR